MRSNQNVVYKMVCTVNNETYIGSTKYLPRRKGEHLYKLRNNKHPNKRIQLLFDNHGECFDFIVLEKCNVEQLKEREQFYFNYLCPTLNICEKSKDSTGFKHSEETKQHLSETFKGMQRSLGRVMSEETRQKISNSRKRYFELERIREK